jgi:hypothetical protein
MKEWQDEQIGCLERYHFSSKTINHTPNCIFFA